MAKPLITCAAAVLLGLFATALAGDGWGWAPARPVESPACTAPASSVAAGGAIADYYKVVRAQYVNLAGNLGTFHTTCFITNNRVQPITLKDVYVLGPGGSTTILATYTGLASVSVPPLGQVRLTIDNSTISGLVAETSLGGSGVKSVVVGWHGPPDALDLTAVIERNDCCGGSYGRAMVSVVGVPLTL
jgi:hypothetical protein